MNASKHIVAQGYYVEIKRGQWVKTEDGQSHTYPGGGIAYNGALTKEQYEGLDAHLRAYLNPAPDGAFVAELRRKVAQHLQGDHHFLVGLLAEITRLAVPEALIPVPRLAIQRLHWVQERLLTASNMNKQQRDVLHSEIQAIIENLKNPAPQGVPSLSEPCAHAGESVPSSAAAGLPDTHEQVHAKLRALYDQIKRKVSAGTWENETYNKGLWDMMLAASTVCEQFELSFTPSPPRLKEE